MCIVPTIDRFGKEGEFWAIEKIPFVFEVYCQLYILISILGASPFVLGSVVYGTLIAAVGWREFCIVPRSRADRFGFVSSFEFIRIITRDVCVEKIRLNEANQKA